ncbi:ABC transporter substrate-binding protein [Streptacidiphilus sp. P02-A3a]|uniref:ABC transporter substrate-binding protein n=1 Tax=Streptacidiphilus sp. P02-A3a TaxID=2704468 RepID=UPI0015F7A77F|nr:extracellular solute-binding protein [Streptacidiphilus sp. P02-A3a]QMU71386.1 extracellular solute-binding protein [Streptacidiphilus sp. P02-A3a]
MNTTRATAAAAALAGTLLLAACGSGTSGTSGGSGSGSGSSASGPAGKVTLTFWDWDPGMNKVVALWNSTHPDIQVRLSNPAGGDQLVSKLITAHQAKQDPDLTKVEYQSLPGLVSNGVVRDITAYTKQAVADYDSATLSATEFQGKVYGVPQDFAPLALFYRADLFQKYHLAVPTTWAQYAQEAAELHQQDPSAYMTNFDSADPGWFTGLAQQAGAQWWTTQGDSWHVDINGPATQQVASYWQGLVDKGLVQKSPSFSPQWNKEMNSGTLATWISGAWAPAQIGGIAPSTQGKWAVAALPGWTSGSAATGVWGGSATTVTTDSAHPAQAAEFATWLNTDPAAVTAQVQDINIYPASTPGRSLPILNQPPAFFPNQPGFYALIKQIAPSARSFSMWGPDVTVTFAAYSDTFGAALQNGTPFTGALDSMQNSTTSDMKRLGFSLH